MTTMVIRVVLPRNTHATMGRSCNRKCLNPLEKCPYRQAADQLINFIAIRLAIFAVLVLFFFRPNNQAGGEQSGEPEPVSVFP